MKTENHTPGPWRVNDNAPLLDIIGNNQQIAYLVTPNQGNGNADKERLANARLIAAAPELLEACRETLLALESMSHQCTLDEWQNDWPIQAQALSQLRAALRKAEGTVCK